MRFNVMALSITAGLFWGVAILIVACANVFWPGYGGAFLELVASMYPGYDASPGIGSIIVGTLYGMVDGAIGGAIFAWLYNFIAQKCPSSAG